MKKILLTAVCWTLLTTTFGQNERAREFYEKGLERAQAEKFEEAIEFFSKSIELQPEDYYSWFNRGLAKKILGLYEDALIDLDQTVKLAPKYKNGYLTRGSTRKRLTDYNGAISDYNNAIKLDANYAEAYYNRGLVYEMLSKNDSACADFKKAMDSGMKAALKRVDKCNDTTKRIIKIHPILRLTKTADSEKYGFTSDKPILVGTGTDGGPANQRAYLDLLRDQQGKPLKYKRLSSCCEYKSANGFFGLATLDEYEIIYLNEKGKEKRATVYISFYDYEEPLILFGFKTVGQR